jgi:hypothetical protein
MLASGGRSERDVVDAAGWLDDQRVIFVVRTSQGLALHAQPVEGETMRLGSWPGVPPQSSFQISPDGARIGALDRDGKPALIDAATLAVTPLAAPEGHAIVGWSAAGDAVWTARLDRWPVEVARCAVASGQSAPLFAIAVPVPGAQPPERLRVAGDGKTYAYSVRVVETRRARVDGALEADR